MFTKETRTHRRGLSLSLLVLSMGLSACSSSGKWSRDRDVGPTPAVRTEDKDSEVPSPRLPPLQGPVRAAWVVRTDLSSRAAVDELVTDAARGRLNTLFVQVRGRGDAWYRGGREPLAKPLWDDPTFDPLRRLVRAAHREGIRVHAWMNVALVAPATGEIAASHVAVRHPNWLSRPRSLGPTATLEELRSLARQTHNVEGVFAEPGDPGYREHVVGIVSDLITGYGIDGVHLDYIRHPTSEFGVAPATVAAFHRSGAAGTTSLTALSKSDERRWHEMLTDGITATVRAVRTELRQSAPEVLLTAAVLADEREARARHQDYGTWLKEHLVDAIVPMNYAIDSAAFSRTAAEILRRHGKSNVWMGVGAWRLDPEEIIRRVEEIDGSGAGGFALFSLGGMSPKSEILQGLRARVTGP